jgi:hypothetical protein
MAYKDILETFWNFPEKENVEVHIHPETIKAIENHPGMKPNLDNWSRNIGERLFPDTVVERGKVRFIYTKNIDAGIDNG